MAVEERLKQLERWKERKALQKDKERREKESKGVFKTGVYHAKNTFSLPAVPTASTKAKEVKENLHKVLILPISCRFLHQTNDSNVQFWLVFQIKGNTAPSQSTRITRSMKQQQQVQRVLLFRYFYYVLTFYSVTLGSKLQMNECFFFQTSSL